MTALATAPSIGSSAAKASTVVPIASPVASLFCNYTLWSAVALLDITSWTQGVDELAEIDQLSRSLRTDFRLIDMLIREDDEIRARATAALRRLSAKFRRDDAYDLVTYDDVSMTALSHPDAFEAHHAAMNA